MFMDDTRRFTRPSPVITIMKQNCTYRSCKYRPSFPFFFPRKKKKFYPFILLERFNNFYLFERWMDGVEKMQNMHALETVI